MKRGDFTSHLRVTVHLQRVYLLEQARKRMLIHSIERRHTRASRLIDTFAFSFSRRDALLLLDKLTRDYRLALYKVRTEKIACIIQRDCQYGRDLDCRVSPICRRRRARARVSLSISLPFGRAISSFSRGRSRLIPFPISSGIFSSSVTRSHSDRVCKFWF